MFKIKQSATFLWPVEVMVAGDGGKFTKETFDAEFERVSQSTLEAMESEITQGKLGDKELARRVTKGWSGVTEDGAEVPFSAGNLEKLLDVPTAAASIVRAFIAANSGVARKN
ncbi:MAG: hypothetical protein LW712_15445 [Burkholderiaceae bacterium]|jgi:hypothetical protein|nr:hypothetical protein [Burkholderiaceae bacterium]